jgi:hypothetical protein
MRYVVHRHCGTRSVSLQPEEKRVGYIVSLLCNFFQPSGDCALEITLRVCPAI